MQKLWQRPHKPWRSNIVFHCGTSHRSWDLLLSAPYRIRTLLSWPFCSSGSSLRFSWWTSSIYAPTPPLVLPSPSQASPSQPSTPLVARGHCCGLPCSTTESRNKWKQPHPSWASIIQCLLPLVRAPSLEIWEAIVDKELWTGRRSAL